jgi:hypothetical protein
MVEEEVDRVSSPGCIRPQEGHQFLQDSIFSGGFLYHLSLYWDFLRRNGDRTVVVSSNCLIRELPSNDLHFGLCCQLRFVT